MTSVHDYGNRLLVGIGDCIASCNIMMGWEAIRFVHEAMGEKTGVQRTSTNCICGLAKGYNLLPIASFLGPHPAKKKKKKSKQNKTKV